MMLLKTHSAFALQVAALVHGLEMTVTIHILGLTIFAKTQKKKGIDNLRSFPFKKDMACWEPNFWHTNLPKEIKDYENDEDINAQYAVFHSILKEHQPCQK